MGTDTTKSFKLNLNDLKKTYPTDVQISTIINELPRVDESGNFIVMFSPLRVYRHQQFSSSELRRRYEFVYAMPKGYKRSYCGTNYFNNYKFVKKNEDVKYLTIHHLAFQANSSLFLSKLNKC